MGLFATPGRCDDAFYSVPLTSLKVTDGKIDDRNLQTTFRTQWGHQGQVNAYVALDGGGEGYLLKRGAEERPWEPWTVGETILVVRSAKGGEITGRLFVPDVPGTPEASPPQAASPPLKELHFTISDATPDARANFLLGKQRHYQRLMDSDAAGAAWFRHQVREVAAQRNVEVADVPKMPQWRGSRFTGRLDDSYSMFTGGRAVSENLQLDREFVAPRVTSGSANPDALVETAKIAGITIAPFDFAAKIKDKKIALDPLASIIPADQHALFFPTFNSVIQALDQVNTHGTLVLGLAEPRSEDQGTFTRYERQLCLPLSELARKLGPAFAKSVAVTGSDPYMATGTDVAILFEAVSPQLVMTFLSAKQVMATGSDPGVKNVTGEVEGIAYRGMVNGDRSICSYVARIGDNVVVTNSLAQLGRLAAVQQHKTPALAEADDYRFFRDRYKKGDAQETALLMLSDATIRRWCGPRWRIGDARRVRAAAVMAELQAQQMDKLLAGKVTPGKIQSDLWFPGGAELNATPTGVISTAYNTPAFLTPIVELPLENVTANEARMYEQWRDGYARNWSGAFDPIAVRFTLQDARLAADLSVIPLILTSEYNQFASVSKGAAISPDAGDRHPGTRAHFIMAFNRESQPARQIGSLATGIVPNLKVDQLGWLGQSISVFADEDPFWDERATAPESEKFFEKNWGRIPVAVHFEVSNSLKLAAFLGAARGYIEQSSPGLTLWETLQYNDMPYVKVSPSREALADDPHMSGGAIYYAVTGKSLVITLSEPLLKRSLDRLAARRKAVADGKTATADGAPWLGESLAVRIDQKLLATGFAIMRNEYQAVMQERSWSNLAILNEWKRLYPDRDPVQVHEQIWGTQLVCPGGGKYIWNEKSRTMESTVYGHPGAPKTGSSVPPALARFATGDFGVTFEDNGLRARVELQRTASPPEPAGKCFGSLECGGNRRATPLRLAAIVVRAFS